MAELPLGARSVVESFAHSLGLDARPAADGSFTFVFQRLGTFSIVPMQAGRGAILTLSRMPRSNETKAERKLLAAGGVDGVKNQLVYSAMAEDGSHLVAVTVEDGDWSLPELDQTLLQLGRIHDELI